MDWDHIARNWQQFNQRVRAKWEKLTDDDLAMINGRRNRLEVKIRQRYGFSSDHIRKEVDDWVRWQRESNRERATCARLLPRSTKPDCNQNSQTLSHVSSRKSSDLVSCPFGELSSQPSGIRSVHTVFVLAWSGRSPPRFSMSSVLT